jgi:polar amino acid transport system substrate-binding protein
MDLMTAAPTQPLFEAARTELAPGGTLKVAIAVGPAGSAVWATRDAAAGEPRGVTVDIARAMSERFGLPLELIEFASSGEIVKAADSGRWTLSFAPVDAERKKQVDFGTDYALGVSTYLVRADTGMETVDDVDAEGVRVLGVEGTATLRSARRTLTKTEARGVTGLDEALASFRAGEVDALALGRESMLSLLPQLPGARIVDGHFHAAGTAIAVPHGNPDALAAAVDVLEMLKANGTIRAIFDRHGMTETEVAPAGSRS